MIVKSINNDNRTYILIHRYDCEENYKKKVVKGNFIFDGEK